MACDAQAVMMLVGIEQERRMLEVRKKERKKEREMWSTVRVRVACACE